MIRRLRNERELSIEALAAEADMHSTSVSQIETGKRNPSWNVVVSLAAALQVEMADLARLAAEQSTT